MKKEGTLIQHKHLLIEWLPDPPHGGERKLPWLYQTRYNTFTIVTRIIHVSLEWQRPSLYAGITFEPPQEHSPDYNSEGEPISEAFREPAQINLYICAIFSLYITLSLGWKSWLLDMYPKLYSEDKNGKE